MATTSTTGKPSRQRVPASERRDALIDAAVHEFAQTGFHGTAVDRIARRVGVAQPYVFSLFGSKRELFLAAVERGFAQVRELMTRAHDEFDPSIALPDTDALTAMGNAYVEMLSTDRDKLMLQLQAYAACDDEVVRERVRSLYAGLVHHVEGLSGADQERIDDFFRYGMWLNVTAAMGVADLSAGCEWIRGDVPESPEG
jgi:AcrR family transcriptional regulator